MIEFNGYLSGTAEKLFFKRTKQYVKTNCLIGTVIGLAATPLTAWIMGVQLSAKMIFYVLCGICAFFLLCVALIHIPKSKKAKRARTPRRIYIEGAWIVCVADKYQERRRIKDVKKVRDHGDFYELVFKFRKLSEKYICQKDLLQKGSIRKFESLFAGKIEQY